MATLQLFDNSSFYLDTSRQLRVLISEDTEEMGVCDVPRGKPHVPISVVALGPSGTRRICPPFTPHVRLPKRLLWCITQLKYEALD